MSSREVRVVMLTSNERRHRFAAATLAAGTNLVGIVTESKAASVASAQADPESPDTAVVRAHFAARDRAEIALLGADPHLPDTEVRSVSRGEINDSRMYDWVRSREPDAVVLFGTGIIRPPLLDGLGVPMINVHLGLSPYYRGSGTNFWPLHNGEPECVGATVHLAVQKVDAGAILAQFRPHAERSDRAHELGTKVIRTAFEALPAVLDACRDGQVRPRTQNLEIGRVYRRADFTPESVRVMWRRFDEGMMDAYLAAVEGRRARFPIVELARSAPASRRAD